MGLPIWLRQKLHTPRELDKGLGGQYKGRYVFLQHHESHGARPMSLYSPLLTLKPVK